MILLKTQIIQLRAPTYFENDQDKKVITSIQSVWVTRPTRNHLGAISACLGPASSAWHKFGGFDIVEIFFRIVSNGPQYKD